MGWSSSLKSIQRLGLELGGKGQVVLKVHPFNAVNEIN